MCILVLDDFLDNLKEVGHSAWNTAKQFIADNKDTVHDFIGTVISNLVPTARPLFDAAWTAFGGKLQS